MSDSPWRLLYDDPADGAWNMAADEAMARAIGEGQAPPTLRLYAWTVPTVSLGYLQRTPGGVDLAACRQRGIPLVRRVTGGRAVLHADELTYSVAVPLRGPWRGLSVPDAFGLIARGLIAGLKRLGITADVGEGGNPSGDGRETGACFLLRRMPAILVGGRKLIGSAQRRWDRSLLQHGSLLLHFDPSLHQAVFPSWPRQDPAAGVTCLQAILGQTPHPRDLASVLAAGWRDAFDTPCVPGEWTLAERTVAGDLARSRYGTPAWTFQR
ncbi:MAG: lipoate--protein ligase family protein [candidate division NC10 bacterium]|nr:lipoate--protein ligase family protein [candidate division NC10 bacterium]MBI2164068.1 lipoate--protein ligase family protein [candidate division NC10 bacterium]